MLACLGLFTASISECELIATFRAPRMAHFAFQSLVSRPFRWFVTSCPWLRKSVQFKRCSCDLLIPCGPTRSRQVGTNDDVSTRRTLRKIPHSGFGVCDHSFLHYLFHMVHCCVSSLQPSFCLGSFNSRVLKASRFSWTRRFGRPIGQSSGEVLALQGGLQV